MNNRNRFHRYAQFLLVYTLLVILWGAWVRISHSGDGCGDTWPLCQGQLIPEAQHTKTWVEYSHRMTSGVFGLLVIFLFWWGRRLYSESESYIRKAITGTMIFTVTEALLGAKLVLFGLVGSNDSGFRLFAMSLHQINSMLLTGSVALVTLYSGYPKKIDKPKIPRWQWSFLVFVVFIAVTGGLAALSSTLFPSQSLSEGFFQDFSEGSHYLLRLRISHPISASLLGGLIALYFWLRSQQENDPIIQKATLHVSLSLILAVVFGYITLLSLAPVWMKLTHLLIAHTVWIVLIRWFTVRQLRR